MAETHLIKPGRIYVIKPIVERFWPKVLVADDDSCWLWIGAREDNNYGIMHIELPKQNGVRKRRTVLAHRASFELHYGPPGEAHVLHECDNPPCVNPLHLFLGDDNDNVQDKIRKGRDLRGSRHQNSKLTEEIVREARRLYKSGMEIKAIAKKFGVCDSTMHPVVKGTAWVHVKD